jgi:DNA end-binding protein Ku
MHYADEVLSIEDALPTAIEKAKSAAEELEVADQLIDAMTRPLDLSQFKDDYRGELEKLIDEKKYGRKTVEAADDLDRRRLGHTTNLMDALRRSLTISRPPQGNGRHPRRRRVH